MTETPAAPVPASPEVIVPAMSDAHHVLSEYHAFMAIASLCGGDAAEAETGASIEVHAVRLAAVLGELLAENAVLRVIAAALAPVSAAGLGEGTVGI